MELNESKESFGYDKVHILHSSLGLTVASREAERIEKDLQKCLLKVKKLSLVVDLDQTVLHATIDPSVENIINGREDIHRITLPESPNQMYYIKFRPGLLLFLETISKLFELHVYTMGSRSYARAVVGLFDPEGKLFYDRVLSRDDAGGITRINPNSNSNSNPSEQKKNLKRIFPADDSTVLIIDDRADVWEYCRNLIPVPPYTFFIGVGDVNRPKFQTSTSTTNGGTTTFLLLSSDEEHKTGIENQADSIITQDDDQELPFIQSLLESIHKEFFLQLEEGEGEGEEPKQKKGKEQEQVKPSSRILPDVKKIVDEKKSRVFKGVSIVFSGIIPLGMQPEHFELWRLSESFGAKCQVSISYDTTHLISFRNDTDKVLQAVEAGIIVVRPEWLLACLKRWERLPIDNFLVKDLPTPNNTIITFQNSLEQVYLDPSELKAMNEELLELENSSSGEDNENYPYHSSKRKRENERSVSSLESASTSSSDSYNSLFEDLEKDFM